MTKLFLSLGLFFVFTFTVPAQQPAPAGQPIINTNVDVNEFQKMIQEKKDIQIVDVRTPGEYKEGHLKQAMNMDFRGDNFLKLIGTLDKNRPTLIYCLSGGRSSAAAVKMKNLGFREVYNLEGGILKWNAAGKPVESPKDAVPVKGMSMEEFNTLLSGDKYILVDYNATWCAPCIKMLPVLESLEKEKQDKLTLLKIDADKNKNLLREKGIEGIPFLELYKDGKLIWKHNGYIERDQLLSETKL